VIVSGPGNAAVIANGGSLTFSNAGAINGNVSLGNGANIVQLFSVSRISGSLDLGTSSASNLILDGSSDQLYSQAVTGATTNAGSLRKLGSGNWLIDVVMNAPVSTNILAGVLWFVPPQKQAAGLASEDVKEASDVVVMSPSAWRTEACRRQNAYATFALASGFKTSKARSIARAASRSPVRDNRGRSSPTMIQLPVPI
jgi:hypothetical protein